jgi:hypothetical protein
MRNMSLTHTIQRKATGLCTGKKATAAPTDNEQESGAWLSTAEKKPVENLR